MDIKGFFDNIDHDLMMKAVRKHTQSKWIVLYIERWLIAPVQLPDGSQQQRDKGTPQGGVISPLLANLFLHYAFDTWMERNYPAIRFERYADDIVIHCKSLGQATMLHQELEQRFAECKLEMSAKKTKIVYCKDGARKKDYPKISFDFLGYTFKPREAKAKNGKIFLSFLPAISAKAAQAIRQSVRGWRLKRRSTLTLEEIAHRINPIVRGWVQYYGRFYRGALYPVMAKIDQHLTKWIKAKHKRVRGKLGCALEWLRRIRSAHPWLFAHWKLAWAAVP